MKALLVNISQLSPRDPSSSLNFEVRTIWSSFFPRKTSATSKSFHTHKNWKIQNEASAGTDKGKTMREKICICVAPSILADSIISPRRLERAYDYGLRVVGLSHYGPGTYAQGTAHDGGLGPKGGELLREMDRLGIILDATHLNDSSFWEAMDIFEGPVWASHSNCRALVPNDRQFCDDQIKYLIERGAVIGGVLDAWMLAPCWERGKSTPAESGVKLENVIDHMEHICELAGNANHVGIGTDLDGGYGREQSPEDLDTIADLQRLPDLLSKRGFDLGQLTGIMHGIFMNFLNKAWA